MNFKNIIFIFLIFFVLFGIAGVSASGGDANLTVMDESIVELESNEIEMENISSQEVLQGSNDEIVVEDWDELQYYCSQSDRDYNLRLKDNTNYYPFNPEDSSYQIKIKNNVKIVGGNGSYIGDSSPDARRVFYALFVVESNARCAMHLENITFKWIIPQKSYDYHKIIQMNGREKYTNVLKNCLFDTLGSTKDTWDALITMGAGTAILDNCSFVNCWSVDGLVRVSDSKMNKTTHMILQNSYFSNNHAAIAPGCVYNSGKLTIINTSFVGNGAGYWAGAVHTTGYGNTTIYDSYFQDNVAGWNGGAMYTYAYLQIYNTTFINNHCTTNNGGGAIGACLYVSTPHIYIEGCLFKENANNCWGLDSLSTTGTGRGGAISFMDGGSIEVRDTSFIANSASIGTAICAWAMAGYGSPTVVIVNNSFINHTRAGDTLNVYASGTPVDVRDNYYYGNSIEFSDLTLTKLSEGREQAEFKITAKITNPSFYDSDILDRTLYDIYINDRYVKTVNTTTFSIDFDDWDICNVYVIPTISNCKSNEVTATSTREYIFVSKSNGNDSNNGASRGSPVYSISKALELAHNCQNIILLDGDYSEDNILIDYEVVIKGEGNATLTNSTSFVAGANFNLKNLRINNLNTGTFVKQTNGNLSISNCIFNDNNASRLIESLNCVISKSIFTNNNALIVFNDGFADIHDSIMLNNSDILQGNPANLEYNWWGNTVPDLGINNYLTLNATSDADALEYNQKANVKFAFYLNGLTKYKNLPEINLDISAVNGTSSLGKVKADENIVFTLNKLGNGVLSAGYNGAQSNITFKFLKSNPNLAVVSAGVMVGDDLAVTVTVRSGVSGNLTVKIANDTQVKNVQGVNTVFTFKDLKAGNHVIHVNYTGDDRYYSQSRTSSVKVSKYQSSTGLNISSLEVNQDIILTISTTGGSTGDVTLTINNNTETLTLNNSKANYTMKKVPVGDYIIKAVYNGDDKYLTSSVSRLIEVGNSVPELNVTINPIIYGEDLIVNVKLNDDATGSVTATADGITNSSTIKNGNAKIILANINAGVNKNIVIFYSGDNSYYNKTVSATYTIDKADLDFSMSYNDVMVGDDVIISLVVPPRTSGTYNINGTTVHIPLSGSVEYVLKDLNVGNYSFTVTYEGNNYNTLSKDVSFSVFEYDSPQWGNSGGNPQNTQKSPYESDTNGEVAYVIPINEEITGDLLIDSMGNIYVTTPSGVYSYNSFASQRWYFTSNDAGYNFSGSAIYRDVIVAPKSGDTLYFINQTTGERFESNIYQGSSLFAPVIGADSNVYISSEFQSDQMGSNDGYNLVVIPYVIWKSGGTPRTAFLMNESPVFSPTVGENIVVVVSDDTFKIFNSKTLGQISRKIGDFSSIRPVIGEGDVVYAVSRDSKYNTYSIVSYRSDGYPLWEKEIPGGVGSHLALGDDGYLYHVNAKGILYKFDTADKGKASKVSNIKVTSGVLIGDDGTLYFASGRTFYAMDNEGNVLWKSDVGYELTGRPVMDRDGLIYITTSDNKVVALTHADLKNPNLNVQVSDIIEGQKETITITLDNQSTGKISFTLNGVDYSKDVGNGQLTFTVSNLDIGSYDFDVNYAGDMRFASAVKHVSFVVRTTGDVANYISFDENSTFGFNLPGAGGNLTVSVNGGNITRKLTNGKASITVDGLEPGEYPVIVYYSGDGAYGAAQRSFTLNVPKISVELNESVLTRVMMSEISITLPGDAGGSFTISVGSRKYSQSVDNGKSTIVIDDLDEGNYTLNLAYSGDDKYLPASKNVNVSLSKIKVTFDSSNLSVISPSETPTVNVNFKKEITGNITVNAEGRIFTKPLAEGRATIELTGFTPGNYTATVSYSGNGNYSTASKQITFEVPKIVLELNDTTLSTVIGTDNATFTVSLPTDARGSLTVSCNNESHTRPVVYGAATVVLENLNPENYVAYVIYSGDDNYETLFREVRFTVAKFSVELNATTLSVVSPSSAPTISIALNSDAGGTVTVEVGGKTFTQNLADGRATVVLDGLKPDKYLAEVTYSGDAKYESANRTVEIEVMKGNLELDLKSNDNIVYVTVKRDATGSVSVSVAGRTFNETLINGSAAVVLEGLSAGSYEAAVSYSGDGNYLAATGTVNVSVPKINVVLDDSNLLVNQSSVSVELAYDATGTLTVTVDDNTFSSSVVGGKATVNVDLNPGSYRASVHYSGDDNYTEADRVIDIDVSKIVLDFRPRVETGMLMATFITDLPDDATGELTITIDGKEYFETVIGPLSPGDYNATIVFEDDDRYESASANVTFTVSKIGVELNDTTLNVISSNAPKIILALSDDATGNLTVIVNGKSYTQRLINGKATVDVVGLTPDNYPAEIIYSGDGKYQNASKTVNLDVTKVETILDEDTLTVEVPKDSTSVDFTINLPFDASGTLTVTINGRNYTQELVNGSATVNADNLLPGNYTAGVIYSGDCNYAGADAEVTFEVHKIVLRLDVDVQTGEDNVTLDVILPEDACGDIVIRMGDNVYQNQLPLFIGGLASGNYEAVVTYTGDEKYAPVNKTVVFAISMVDVQLNDTTLSVVSPSSTPGFSLNLPEDACGNLTVIVNGKAYTAVVVKGGASLVIDDLNPGNYSAEVIYSGDDKYATASRDVGIEVPKIKIDLELTAADGRIDAALAGDATGRVTVNVASRTYSGKLVDGRASIRLEGLAPGSYNASVAYSGDSKYLSADGIVEVTVPKIDVDFNESSLIVDPYSVSLKLADDATGTLTVSVNGENYTADVINGRATVNLNLAPGNYSLNISYSGDCNYTGASRMADVNVSKIVLNLKVKVETGIGSATFTANLPDDAESDVTVNLGVNEYRGKLPIVVSGLNPGPYEAVVSYVGDDKYEQVNATVKFTVSKVNVELDDDELTVSSNGNASTISLSLNDDAAGTLAVTVNGRTYAENVTGGKATVYVDGLAPGNHSATVIYSGDAKYGPASRTVNVEVSKLNPDWVLQADLNVVNVELASDVGGTVTVSVNGMTYIENLVNGRASVKLDNLTPGSYNASVTYSGDEKYLGRTGSVSIEIPKRDVVLNDYNLFVNQTCISVELPDDAAGTLTVTVNGNDYVSEVVGGMATVNVDDLAPGNHFLNIVYSGDDKYSDAIKIVEISIPKFILDLKANVKTGLCNASFTADLPDDAASSLVVVIDGMVYKGAMPVTVVLNPGDYNATVIYPGDYKYEAANDTVEFTISRINVELYDDILSIESTGICSTIGINLPDDATGTLTVSIDGKNYTAELVDGSAAVSVDGLAAGSYNAIVVYSGDNKYSSVSRTFSVNVPEIKTDLDDDTLAVDSSGISISLPDDAAGTLTVSIDGKNYTAEVVNGSAAVSFDGLASGSYSAEISYSGDGKYSPASKTVLISIPKVETELDEDTLTVDDSKGAESTFSIDLPEDASGTLTVSISGRNYTAEVVKGKASVNVGNLTPGSYNATVSYSGDGKYSQASKTTSVNVSKVKTGLDDTTLIVDIPEGSGSSSFSIDLPEDASGTLTVTVDGENYTADVVKGKATVNVKDLSAGNHSVVVTYSGDSKYSSSVKSDVVTISETSTDKKAADLTVTVSDITVGENAVVNVKTSASVVTVRLDNRTYNLSVADGKASLAVSGLAAGNYDVIVEFAGDDQWLEARNATSFSVSKRAVSQDAISDSDDPAVYSITLPGDATGTLTVTVDGVNYTEKLENGRATVRIAELGGGSHNITVAYSGDAVYSPIVKTRTVKIPVISLTGSDVRMLYKSGKSYEVCLTQDGAPLAGRNIVFTINGRTYDAVTDSRGIASVKIKLAPNTYTVTAAYAGVNTTNTAVVKSIIKAKNVNAKKSAKSVKIKVRLKKVNKKYLKGKKLTLKFNKKKFKAKTNKKGVATFKIKNGVYKKLKAGKKYKYQVKYGKDKVRKTIKFK